MQNDIDISVIIVNYKVKEYIANLLNSLQKAQHGLNLQIFVVDNDSGDDSIPYLKKRFPNVEYIQNKKNVGFGKANNQAIEKATGTFTLIINPDTLVSEDTLTTLVSHMQKDEECGAAGCKILNPDGTFAPESRRSVPTIWSAACKVFGLNNLSPNSKLFGQYYLSWIPEDVQTEVPVLSGSFMFWRTELLKNLGGFDERFFMYAEDIDLCYRVQETDFRIDYIPHTSIIHYKGESTKKGDLKYIRIFNQALYQFFEKHYSSNYSMFFRFFILISIWLKTFLSFLGSSFKKAKVLIVELLILNVSVAVGFVIRYGLQGENILNPDGLRLLWINLLASVIYLLSGSFLGMYREKKDSISATLKALFTTYVGVVFVTFFVRDLAYSRLGLIIGCAVGVILFVSYKLLIINNSSSVEHGRGKFRNWKVIIVGNESSTADIITKIHSRPDWNYDVIGSVTVHDSDHLNSNNQIGSISQLRDLVRAYKADQVFFALKSISYKQMLKEISNLQNEDVIFKLIPDSMDFILGKSNVEYLESIPLVEVDLDYNKPINLALKRMMDLIISFPAFLLIFLFTWPAVLIGKKNFVRIQRFKFYEDIHQHKWKNRLRLLGYVLSGRLSLIGSPIVPAEKQTSITAKKGISGIVQINRNKIQKAEDVENFELYYLQNYSIWMDIDILIKTIINGPKPIHILVEFDNKSEKNKNEGRVVRN